jgi:hypothetical protein
MKCFILNQIIEALLFPLKHDLNLISVLFPKNSCKCKREKEGKRKRERKKPKEILSKQF